MSKPSTQGKVNKGHKWKPGQSGNPTGRPSNDKVRLKAFSLKTVGKDLKELLKVNAQMAIIELWPKIEERAKDSVDLTKLLFEYGFGKPKQQIEVVVVNYDFTAWTPDEIRLFQDTGVMPQTGNNNEAEPVKAKALPLIEIKVD